MHRSIFAEHRHTDNSYQVLTIWHVGQVSRRCQCRILGRDALCITQKGETQPLSAGVTDLAAATRRAAAPSAWPCAASIAGFTLSSSGPDRPLGVPSLLYATLTSIWALGQKLVMHECSNFSFNVDRTNMLSRQRLSASGI